MFQVVIFPSQYSVLWIFFFSSFEISNSYTKETNLLFFFLVAVCKFAGMTLVKWRQYLQSDLCVCVCVFVSGVDTVLSAKKKQKKTTTTKKNSRIIITVYSFFFYSHAITCSFWHTITKICYSLTELVICSDWNNMYSYISFSQVWIHNVVYEICYSIYIYF